jgi:hypothetical protein
VRNILLMLRLILRAREQLGKGNVTAELQTVYFLDEKLITHANETGRQNLSLK